MNSIERLTNKVDLINGIVKHLMIRSELTLIALASIIESGAVKQEGVLELIHNAKFNAPLINEDIIEKEKELVSNYLKKVNIV